MKKLSKVSLTKRLSVIVLVLTFCIALIPAVQAEKSIRWEMAVHFNPAVMTDPTEPIWEGPLHGDIDAWMIFYAVGPIPPKDVGKVHFFCEEWYIIDSEGDEIWGYDKGSTSKANWRFRMNGEITDATGKYADLVGHQVHMHGQITWTEFGPTGPLAGIAEGPIIIT
ncbi:MAG: hypothetical protein ACW96M_05550 [Candidatus Thorarchaeota archaeon]